MQVGRAWGAGVFAFGVGCALACGGGSSSGGASGACGQLYDAYFGGACAAPLPSDEIASARLFVYSKSES